MEAKTWCGTELGLGSFDEAVYRIADAGVCAPGGFLELPTPGWPGPNEGTAFVTTGTPWNGNYVPVYWFGGYAYPGAGGSTAVPISIDPPTGFCGFSNCASPPVSYAVAEHSRGVMGVNGGGVVPEFWWPPEGACCLPEPLGACEVMSESMCYAQGGFYLGDFTDCDPNPCPQPGACCVGGFCELMMEETCVLVQGVFQGPGTTCEPNPCEAVCCDHESGSCWITLQHLCEPNYVWHPEWTTCHPNPCWYPSPSSGVSWGKIKEMYR